MPNLINRSTMKVLESVRTHPSIILRGIIAETRLSPNAVSDIVNDLVRSRVLNEKRLEKKRVYVRQFFIHSVSQLTPHLFALIEEEKKRGLYQKHPRLKAIGEQVIQTFPPIKSFLIYGSYAKGTETKESDIDLLIVGSVSNKERLREILFTLEAEPSVKVESVKDFKKRIADSLHQEILRHHVLLHDTGIFIKEMLKTAGKAQ